MTHVSAPERRAFVALLEEGMVDVVRPHTPGEYTYWDYQSGRFTRMRVCALTSAVLARARRTCGTCLDR